MKIYQPDFKSFLSRINELVEYKEKSKSRTLIIYIDHLIDLTCHSLSIFESLTGFLYPRLRKNAKESLDKYILIAELNKTRLPDDFDEIDIHSKRILEDPIFSEEEKENVKKNMALLSKSKRLNHEIISRTTEEVSELVFLEKAMDNAIHNHFLNSTAIPLFENIYQPSLRKVESQLSYNLMVSLVKYGIEKLGITGKAEAELVNDIRTSVNGKKFVLDQIENADFVLTEIFEPYEDSVLTWIITNDTILSHLKKHNKA